MKVCLGKVSTFKRFSGLTFVLDILLDVAFISLLWRRSGVMVSALDSRFRGMSSIPCCGHRTVFFALTVCLSAQGCKWVMAN